MTGDETWTDRSQPGSRSRSDRGSTLARGLVAGAAGVAAMTLARRSSRASPAGRTPSFPPTPFAASLVCRRGPIATGSG